MDLPEALHSTLRIEAAVEGRSMDAITTTALRGALRDPCLEPGGLRARIPPTSPIIRVAPQPYPLNSFDKHWCGDGEAWPTALCEGSTVPVLPGSSWRQCAVGSATGTRVVTWATIIRLRMPDRARDALQREIAYMEEIDMAVVVLHGRNEVADMQA